MLHSGDVVEEVATQRQGRIDAVDTLIENGETKQHRWRVRFDDASQPNTQYFLKAEDLRLVSCPHMRQVSVNPLTSTYPEHLDYPEHLELAVKGP